MDRLLDTSAQDMTVCDGEPAASDRWRRLQELLVRAWRRQLLWRPDGNDPE